MKHRTIIFPVILHPPSQDGIEHPRQVFQGFVAPQLEFPASDFLSDGLCSFVAYSRQEAHEVFPPVVSSPPGSELIAQEGKLLVLMRSSPIRILAINDFGFLEVKLQSAFRHPQDDRFAQAFGFLLRSAMHDGIIGIPLKGDAWVLARHPRIEAVVQEKVCQQGRGSAPIHESCLRLAFLLKARRSAGRWWSSDKADWKSVVVTWSGRRLCPLHCMNRLLLKRNIIPRTNIALSLRTRQRSSLWEISKR